MIFHNENLSILFHKKCVIDSLFHVIDPTRLHNGFGKIKFYNQPCFPVKQNKHLVCQKMLLEVPISLFVKMLSEICYCNTLGFKIHSRVITLIVIFKYFYIFHLNLSIKHSDKINYKGIIYKFAINTERRLIYKPLSAKKLILTILIPVESRTVPLHLCGEQNELRNV